MNLQYLRYAVEVARSGSITKSAEVLFMAQPNLSNAIKSLEHEVGITIFQRSSKGVALTRDGEEFIEYARSVLSQIDSLESRYFAVKESVTRLSVSSVRSSRVALTMVDYLNSLSEPYQVHFKETTVFDVISDVADDLAELGVIKYSESQQDYFHKLTRSKNIKVIPLTEEHSNLLMSEQHPLAQVPRITLDMLLPFTEIVHGDIKEPITLKPANIGDESLSTQQSVYVYDRGSLNLFVSRLEGGFMWTTFTEPFMLQAYRLVERTCEGVDKNIYEALIHKQGNAVAQRAAAFSAKLKERITGRG